MVRVQGVTQSEDETEPENGEIGRISHAGPRTIHRRRSARTDAARESEARSDGDGPLLSAARVHLEMRIIAQAIDADQSAFTQPRTLQRFSFFCAPVATRLPPSANERQHL